MKINPREPLQAAKYYVVHTRFLFNCHIKLKLPISTPPGVADRCFDIMADTDRRYNSYSDESYFDKINRNSGCWVEVDEVTSSLIQQLLEVTKATSGAFNVAVLPLLKQWGFYDVKADATPDLNKISKLATHLASHHVEISGNLVRIHSGLSIVTGSFIKSFAVDRVVQFLKQEGINDALINAGGSTIVAINNDLHPQWRIEIPHPDSHEQILTEIRLSNAAFSLSACNNNFIDVRGVRIGHILNCKTGMPTANLQAVAICSSSFWSDIFATALQASDHQPFEEVATALCKLHPMTCYVLEQSWDGRVPKLLTFTP